MDINKYYPSCAGFIVICKEHVLLVCTHKNVWGFPKGKRNTKEKHIDCAYRELKEETGLDTKDIITVDIDTFWLHELSNKGTPSVRLYIATTSELIKPNVQDTDELSTASWIKISEAHKLLKIKNRSQILRDAVNYIHFSTPHHI